jgi:hypothetical protein
MHRYAHFSKSHIITTAVIDLRHNTHASRRALVIIAVSASASRRLRPKRHRDDYYAFRHSRGHFAISKLDYDASHFSIAVLRIAAAAPEYASLVTQGRTISGGISRSARSGATFSAISPCFIELISWAVRRPSISSISPDNTDQIVGQFHDELHRPTTARSPVTVGADSYCRCILAVEHRRSAGF